LSSELELEAAPVPEAFAVEASWALPWNAVDSLEAAALAAFICA
jgi:hypothetical protein